MSTDTRRVALIADARFYVGPDLARLLAARGHDLVLGDPSDELLGELAETGAAVEAVSGCRDLSDPASSERIVGGRPGPVRAYRRGHCRVRARRHRTVSAFEHR